MHTIIIISATIVVIVFTIIITIIRTAQQEWLQPQALWKAERTEPKGGRGAKNCLHCIETLSHFSQNDDHIIILNQNHQMLTRSKTLPALRCFHTDPKSLGRISFITWKILTGSPFEGCLNCLALVELSWVCHCGFLKRNKIGAMQLIKDSKWSFNTTLYLKDTLIQQFFPIVSSSLIPMDFLGENFVTLISQFSHAPNVYR